MEKSIFDALDLYASLLGTPQHLRFHAYDGIGPDVLSVKCITISDIHEKKIVLLEVGVQFVRKYSIGL